MRTYVINITVRGEADWSSGVFMRNFRSGIPFRVKGGTEFLLEFRGTPPELPEFRSTGTEISNSDFRATLECTL